MNATPSMGPAPTTTTNPLVVQGEETKATEGLGIFRDAAEAVDAAGKGNWTEGILNTGAALMGIAEFVMDPAAALISMGFGWLMEHVPFLKEPLDWLTGDQETLDGMSKTWGAISNHFELVSTDLKDWVGNDTGAWTGLDVDAYKGFGTERADTYGAVGTAAQGISVLINICKTVLNVVRGTVRDIISEAVGKLISICLRWAPAVPAFGAGVAGIIAEAIPVAVKYANEAMDWCKKLAKAFSNAMSIFQKLEDVLGRAKTSLASGGADAVQALRKSASLVPKLSFDLAKEDAKVLDHEWQTRRQAEAEKKKE